MADNDQSKIRYDDFISNVQPDPAKPESTIMLSGFVGHGPDGHARIYPDPTLGTWYDVPEDDILHSTPIADSKLGGSYIWVRASAQIKPGSAAGSGTGSVAEGVPAAGPQPAANPQLTDATCYTCPPFYITFGGPCVTRNPAFCHAPLAGPAPAAMALPHTAATVCTQFGCPPQGPVGGQAGTFHFTNWCSLVGCNPPTNGCGVAAAAPQAAYGGMNPTPQSHCFVCDPPNMLAAVQPPAPAGFTVLGCVTLVTCPTSLRICPSQHCQGGAQQHQEAVAAATPVNTMACFTLGGCLTLQMCPTPITICPTQRCQGGAQQHQDAAATAGTVCFTMGGGCLTFGMCPTWRCQQGGAQQHQEAAAVAPTAAPGCWPLTRDGICHPTVYVAGCPTVTLIGCVTGFCPTMAAGCQNGVFTPFGR